MIPKNYDILYNNFANTCLTPVKNLNGRKLAFLHIKDTFLRGKQVNSLCNKTNNLVNHLMKLGNKELANILIGEIGKMHMSMRNFTAAEPYIKASLELSREMNDNFHVLARLNDLQEIYKNTRNRHDYFTILREKKECLKELITNYSENVKNYHSINRPPTRLNALKMQLAYNYRLVAELLWHNKPLNCMHANEKAREIYLELGRNKEARDIDGIIRQIQARLQNASNNHQISIQQ